VNPWSQVYKIATGKTKEVNKMTTINRPDGTETTKLQETINEILDRLYKEDGEEEKPNHKSIRKAVEEPIHTEDDVEFTPEEIKHTIESFGQKKAPGPDGITGGKYQRIPFVSQNYYYYVQPMLIFRTIPKGWKIAKVILVLRPNKDNYQDPSKFRRISLLNMGGKILDKLLINRINYHLYKNELLSQRQYGFTPKKYNRRSNGS